MIPPHHPVVERAARGEIPGWAQATAARVAHMGRVAALLEEWATGLGLPEAERCRWLAAAHLHDALRNADPEELRAGVQPECALLPGPLLHGPAAAQRLWVDGVRDGELLNAVAFHTLGHPALRVMGRALYAADFLEPGRDLLNEWRAELRGRMPGELDEVVRQVLGARIGHLVELRAPLRPETVAFWNALMGDDR
ncbi:MAG TPA: HD domain-containing protein [Longimicrobiales bacterium]|nr:HD domain-containing protein [Longimicrobiales bacterium]